MELDDCITKDCSTIYRFQFASIAFICGVYLPFTFHSSIWSLYTQSFKPVNCTAFDNALHFGTTNNLTVRPWPPIAWRTQNRSECCTCNGLLNGTTSDKRLLALCQEWMGSLSDLDTRKATIIDEVSAIDFLLRQHVTVGSILSNLCFSVAFGMWKREPQKCDAGRHFVLHRGDSRCAHHWLLSWSIRKETSPADVPLHSGGLYLIRRPCISSESLRSSSAIRILSGIYYYLLVISHPSMACRIPQQGRHLSLRVY